MQTILNAIACFERLQGAFDAGGEEAVISVLSSLPPEGISKEVIWDTCRSLVRVGQRLSGTYESAKDCFTEWLLQKGVVDPQTNLEIGVKERITVGIQLIKNICDFFHPDNLQKLHADIEHLLFCEEFCKKNVQYRPEWPTLICYPRQIPATMRSEHIIDIAQSDALVDIARGKKWLLYSLEYDADLVFETVRELSTRYDYFDFDRGRGWGVNYENDHEEEFKKLYEYFWNEVRFCQLRLERSILNNELPLGWKKPFPYEIVRDINSVREIAEFNYRYLHYFRTKNPEKTLSADQESEQQIAYDNCLHAMRTFGVDIPDWLPEGHASEYSTWGKLISFLQAQKTPVYVTLSQAARIAGKSKKTLEGWKQDGRLPPPEVPHSGRAEARWLWSTIHPALEQLTKKRLPKCPTPEELNIDSQ